MAVKAERNDATSLHCSVCKHPVSLRAGQGRRRAALIEDGLTLCDVCAPSGNHLSLRLSR